MRKTRHRTGTAESRMSVVPATGGVAGRESAGRLAGALIATTFALAADLGAVLAVVVDPVAPSVIPPGRLLVDAAVASVAAAAAWSVASPRWRVSAGMAVLVAGWLLPTWAGWLDRSGTLTVVLLAAAPAMVAGVATVALSWSGARSPTLQWALRGSLA